MKNNKFSNNNKGFSLVELIIVIGIIAVMTGVSMVTITLLNSSRARESAVTFEAEVSALIERSRGQTCVVGGVEKPSYYHCLKIYVDGSKTYIQQGYCYKDTTYSGTETKFSAKTEKYVFVPKDSTDKGVAMSTKVSMRYIDSSMSASEAIGNGASDIHEAFIIYDKKGMCLQGVGTFEFYKKNGNNVANVTIQKNGSHQSD